MTFKTLTALALGAALLPGLAAAQTFRAAEPAPAIGGFTTAPTGGNPNAATAEGWQRRAEIICGGDAFITYEEDANGQPINGTVRTTCLDD